MLLQRLKSDLIISLKSGDAFAVSVLRMLISALNYEKIDKQHELTDEEILAVLVREVKKRREAVLLYRQGNREELAAKEEKEITIIAAYMPKQLSDAEIRSEVEKILSGISDADKLNFGRTMSTVMGVLKGKADGALISKTVKEILGQ